MIELIFRSRGSQTVQTIVLLEMLITLLATPGYTCCYKVNFSLGSGEIVNIFFSWSHSKKITIPSGKY